MVKKTFSAPISHITDGLNEINKLSKFERLARYFWLFGPFLMLIERTPADAWISLLVIFFVIRSFVVSDFRWLRVFWVKAAFGFWLVCIFSSAISDDPLYSIGEAIVWFRFPLFAIASAYWLAINRKILLLMFYSVGGGMIAMCFILAAELLIVGQQYSRLSWPYGDLVPGNYLAKACLPAFLLLIAIATSTRGKSSVQSCVLAVVTLLFSVAAGERINFLIRACSGMLAGLVWRPIWWKYLVLIGIELTAVGVAIGSKPKVLDRFVANFIEQLPVHADSLYFRAMMPGVLAFKESPWFGIGTGNFRNMCGQITRGTNGLDCHPHPHNFYIQLAAETGLVGLFAGVTFIGALFWYTLQGGDKAQARRGSCNRVYTRPCVFLANCLDIRFFRSVEQLFHVECFSHKPKLAFVDLQSQFP